MLNHIPSITALRALEAIERLGTVRLAAEELHITPSAVSHQIASLEQQMEVMLFDRSSRALILTSEGQTYLKAIRPLLLNIDEASREVKEKKRAGTLTIQSYPSFCHWWLIPHLPSFLKRYPEIPVNVISTSSPMDFSRPEVDAAIVHHMEPIRGFQTHATFSSEVFPVCSKSYLAKSRALNRPEDLQHHELIQNAIIPGEWNQWLQSIGVNIDVRLTEGNSFETRDLSVEAARHGMGVALAITPLVNMSLNNGTLTEPLGTRIDYRGNCTLIARDDASLPKRFTLFREWLAKELNAG